MNGRSSISSLARPEGPAAVGQFDPTIAPRLEERLTVFELSIGYDSNDLDWPLLIGKGREQQFTGGDFRQLTDARLANLNIDPEAISRATLKSASPAATASPTR